MISDLFYTDEYIEWLFLISIVVGIIETLLYDATVRVPLIANINNNNNNSIKSPRLEFIQINSTPTFPYEMCIFTNKL